MKMGRGLTVLLLVTGTLLAKDAHALPERTWVVAVGNNHGHRTETSLLYAESDARSMADVLRAHSGIPSRQIRVLLDEDPSVVRRTLEDVNATIRRFSDREKTAFVIYYSGHADAKQLHLGSQDFEVAELRDLVQGSSADLRLLVIDACRSGSATRSKGMRGADTFAVELDEASGVEGFVTIASSALGEASQESDELRGSFFSHHWVNALRGAADNDLDGQVTLSEAYSYAYGQTVKSTGRTLALQHPTYTYDVEGQGDLVISTPGRDESRFGRLRLAEPTEYLIMDRSRRELVAEVNPSTQNAVIALPARDYFVQERHREYYREFNVSVPVGGEIALNPTQAARVEYDRLVRKRGGTDNYTHSFTALGGVQSGLLPGEGATPSATLGYGLDFPWLSLGLRTRLATVEDTGLDERAPRTRRSVAVDLAVQRFIDTRLLTLGFGVTVGGTMHNQSFDLENREADERTGFGFSFGALFSVERSLGRGVSVRLEGGPVADAFPAAEPTPQGNLNERTEFQITGWGALGLVWRL
ncbi:MAG: caspase family protein [Myxococcota bacterium]